MRSGFPFTYICIEIHLMYYNVIHQEDKLKAVGKYNQIFMFFCSFSRVDNKVDYLLNAFVLKKYKIYLNKY